MPASLLWTKLRNTFASNLLDELMQLIQGELSVDDLEMGKNNWFAQISADTDE